MNRTQTKGAALRPMSPGVAPRFAQILRCSAARRVALCRDARLVRPLYQRLLHRGFNGNGRTDGLRLSRESLQRATRF